MNQKINSKKSISSVIAVSALIIITIFGIFIFQSSYIQTLSSQMTDLDTQTKESTTNSHIEEVLVDSIYFRNNEIDNLTIRQIKLGDRACNISQMNISKGLEEIELNNCTYNLTTGVMEVLVVTDKNIFSKQMYVEGVEPPPPPLCAGLAGGEWVEVEGNPTYNTSNFCVMKYEAKNVGGVATSQADDTPWVYINWYNSVSNCSALGTNYHLITDNEWLTIAKEIEEEAYNWGSSIVGTGYVYLGHTDNQPNIILNATDDDLDGYYRTDENTSYCDGYYVGFVDASDDTVTGRACKGQRRTLALKNGDIIWDFSGNVWEWVNDTIAKDSRYHGGAAKEMTYDNEVGLIKATNVPAIKLPSNNWDADNGMGRYYDGYSTTGGWNIDNIPPDTCSFARCASIVAFSRGGAYKYGLMSGIYSLNLDQGRGGRFDYGASQGFRCTYTP